MALNPEIIAALTAGAKTASTVSGEDLDARMQSWMGTQGQDQGGAWNLGQGIIDILSTGGYASAGLTNKIGQNVAAMQRGDLGGLADLVNPFAGIGAIVKGVSERRTYSDNLKEMGVGDDVAPWLGLALDIGLDPLTYVTGGTIAGVRGVAQGAKVAGQVAKAGQRLIPKSELAADASKLIDALPSQVTDLGRPLTDSERIGNLLTGISRGWTGARAARTLTIKGNKLEKVTRREARKMGVDTTDLNIQDVVRGRADEIAANPAVARAAAGYQRAAEAANVPASATAIKLPEPIPIDPPKGGKQSWPSLAAVIAPMRTAYFTAREATEPAIKYSTIKASPDAPLIAKYYADAADAASDPAVISAYGDFAREVDDQYRYLTEELGIEVVFVRGDPYNINGVPSPGAMMRDIAENRRLQVRDSSEDLAINPHALLSAEQTNRFRAVHDFFGHASSGRGFLQDGEEAAWVAHSTMFSLNARRAMTTETRGQNSYYNTYGEFAPNRAFLLPDEWVLTPGETADMSKAFADAEKLDKSLARTNQSLVAVADLEASLDNFAGTVYVDRPYSQGARPAPQVKTGRKKPVPLADFMTQVNARLDEIRLSELTPLALSAAKLEKVTPETLLNILKKDPADRSDTEWILLEELKTVTVSIDEYPELGEFLAISRAEKTAGVTTEQRRAWAAEINSDPRLQKVLRDNAKYLADAEADVARIGKEAEQLSKKLAAARTAAEKAGKKTSPQVKKLNTELGKKLDEQADAEAKVARIRVEGAPPTRGYEDFTMVDRPKFTEDDYWVFANRRGFKAPAAAEPAAAPVDELAGPTAKELREIAKEGKGPQKPATAETRLTPKEALSPEDWAEYQGIITKIRNIENRRRGSLTPEETAEIDALKARREELYPATQLETVRYVGPSTMGPGRLAEDSMGGSRPGVVEGSYVDRLSPGVATEVSLLEVAQAAARAGAKGRSPEVINQAKSAFQNAKKNLIDEINAGPKELKPWIDDIATASDAGRAAVALVRYIAPQLEEASPAFDQVKLAIEQLLDGKLRLKGGNGPLSSTQIEEVLEEIWSGREITNIFNAAEGLIDMAAVNAPKTFKTYKELAEALKRGEVDLDPLQIARLAGILKVPTSATDGAKQAFIDKYESIARLEDRRIRILEQQAHNRQVVGRILMGPVSMGKAIQATGDSAGEAVGAQLDEVLDLEPQVADDVDEAIAIGEADEPAVAGSSLSAGAQAEIDALRTLAIDDLNAAIDALVTLYGRSDKTRATVMRSVIDLVIRTERNSFAGGAISAIKEIAKGRNKDPKLLEAETAALTEEILTSGTRSLSTDEAATLSPRTIVFNQAGSESRYTFYTQSSNDARRAFQKDEASLVTYETLKNLAAEALLRVMGIPVRTTENLAMKLRRNGITNISERIPTEATPLISNVTFADIMSAILRSGDTKLAQALRQRRGKPNTSYGSGNFLPSSIEGAWLVIKDAVAAGRSIEKGSPAWDEAMLALNTRYKAPKQATSDLPVDELFADAPHVVAARVLGGKDAKEIAQASDDYLTFLINNANDLLQLDNSRAVITAAIDSGPVYEQVSRTYKALIAYAVKLGAMGSKMESHILNGTFEAGYNEILTEFNNLLDFFRVGDLADPDQARNIADVISQVFTSAVAGSKRDTYEFMLKIRSQVMEDLLKIRSISDAIHGPKAGRAKKAKPITPAQQQRGVDARTRAAETEIASALPVAEAAVKNSQANRATASAEIVDDTVNNAPAGPISESGDATLDTLAAVAVDRLGKTGRITGEGLMRMLSGSHGMGKYAKTVINGAEHRNISSVINFGYGLREIKRLFRGREAELSKAFVALQRYRAAEKISIETTTELADLKSWLAAEKIDYGSEEALQYMQAAVESIFGNGSTLGIVARTGIFARELNRHLGKIGLAKGGETGKGFIVPNDTSPEMLDYFWTSVRLDELEDADPLLFLHKAAAAIHNAAAQVEVAQQLSYFFGRTAAEIAETGDNLADYVKIDPQSEFGRILGETDRLFLRSELEKLRYVQEYLSYDKTFSDSALKSILDISDRITYVLKSSNTLWRMGHHVVSIVGETVMNALAGVRPSAYNHVTRILSGVRPGIYRSKENPFGAYIELNAAKGMRVKTENLNGVHWVTPNGKKQFLTDEAVYLLAERNGALVKPGSSLEDLLADDRTLARGWYASFNRVNDKLAVAASYRDNFFRLAHFIDELQKVKGAKNIEEAAVSAATAVREWHPTVGGLSAWEKKYARRAVYFYTWQRLALTKIVMTAIDKPGVATIPSKIQYAIADANGFNPESFGDPWDPQGMYASWHTGSVFGPQFGSAADNDAWGIQPAVQPLDIMGQITKPFTIQPGEQPLTTLAGGVGELAGANLNPVIKTLIESTAQSRLGEGGALPSPSEYVLNQIGVLSTLSKVSGIGQDPNPYETPEERAQNNDRLLLNLITGQRITDYSTPATQFKWEMDQYQMLRRMAGLDQ